jgi:hypothetical protein
MFCYSKQNFWVLSFKDIIYGQKICDKWNLELQNLKKLKGEKGLQNLTKLFSRPVKLGI